MTYNLQMSHDEALEEFVQILGRIKDLLREDAIAGAEGIDLVGAIERARQSGNDKVADELAGLCKRAEELQTQHQAKS